MRTTTFETILTATAVSLFSLTFGTGAPQGAMDHPSEPIPGHEECTPLHAVSVLRNHVQWSARENAPVALGAEFTSETIDGASDSVAWRLVLTTMDRTVVDSRTGTARLNDGRSIVAETFDGKDSAGHPLAPGLYVYRFEADDYEGSGGFLRVYGSDETPDAPVDDTREPLAASTNPSVPYNFDFGSQHAHTNYSDGGTAVATCTGSISSPHPGATPTDAFAYAKASGGVDWICVIEHNHLIDDACQPSAPLSPKIKVPAIRIRSRRRGGKGHSPPSCRDGRRAGLPSAGSSGASRPWGAECGSPPQAPGR
jgi:hypothetical protein